MAVQDGSQGGGGVDVRSIFSASGKYGDRRDAFAALKADGNIVTWGHSEYVQAARGKAMAAEKHGVAPREVGA